MELLAFASTAAKSVCSLALDLSKEESADDAAAGINPTTKPFYNALVNSLSAVHRHLESPESTNIGGNKLAKLLNELERLCNVSTRNLVEPIFQSSHSPRVSLNAQSLSGKIRSIHEH